MQVQTSQTEAQVLSVVRHFLLSVLPHGVEVVRGQINRVPEPAGDDYLVLWPILRERLSTNVVTYFDDPAAQMLPPQTRPLLNDDGQVLLSQSGQPLLASLPTQYRPGQKNTKTATQVTVQVDVHGPLSGDNVQIIETLFRDEYACRIFNEGIPLTGDDGVPLQAEDGFVLLSQPIEVQPLYAGPPRMVPFENAESQIEMRWSIDLVLQANPTTTTPQDFASVVTVGLSNVDVTYPPGDS